jgi:hypothetical protein
MPNTPTPQATTKGEASRKFIKVLISSVALLYAFTNANGKTIDGQVFIVTAAGPAIKLALVEVRLFAQADIERHIRDIDLAPDSERSKADTALAKAREDLQAAERAVAGPHGYDEKMRGLAYAEWVGRYQHSPADGHEVALRFNAAWERVSQVKERVTQMLLRQKLSRAGAPYFDNLPTPIASVKTDADGRFQVTVSDEQDYALMATSSRTLFNIIERYFWIVRVKPQDSKVTLSNDNLTTSGSEDSLVKILPNLPPKR